MNKNIVVSFLLAMTLGDTLLPVAAKADELKSDITVNVDAGTGAGPAEEEISEKTPRDGEFIIKAVSDFNYPSVPLGETRAATIAKDKAYGIEVVDVTGNGTGWNVKVAMDSFKVKGGVNDGEDLKGWELTIPTAEVTSKSASIRPENTPVGKEAKISGTLSSVVFKADAGKGMGRYTNIFERYADNQEPTRTTGVQLSIPNTARKASYIGKLNWTLTNTPN
ncbi:WxL domain-containing protein [Candidatus Enterococcus ikei]|uniref:WxL domain-containing protein n=1 Tax=Candidatus Enterococcus ikei TaxID=2815326 RepID=A0ABS3H310_9ENTE|nr:WxL domain-containing protein [Enterococcus sp. DIV0869a]MBO0441569.1 WxL domain-containing protein [Enterococcus sp. DIV0869a]